MTKKVAAEIIGIAKKKRAYPSWIDNMPASDRQTIDDIIKIVVADPSIHLKSVAIELVRRMEIPRTAGSVAATLKELVNHAKEK